ncbi:HTTM domain-containing protein [Chryseobacterium gleum]|uniref:HTTM domain-containing protein n=1 Tax=Chryseobacterium gleum TaxID=250 RepID=UPI001E565FDB|nr:HTTM domain-containing protein [Chryseobacterium gleum]MCD9617430.1 HTTM domain-containing protein [Chryseobacterium gleum]
MLIIEGGDQISLVLSVLLIPLCLVDKRKNGWINNRVVYNNNSLLYINSKWALLFIQIQVAILYFNAGTAKMYAPEWTNGTAVYYWFNDNVFGAVPIIKHVFGFLFKNEMTVSFINWGSIILEIFIFSAIFLKQEIKYLIFVPAILFHLTIIIIHGLPTFFIAMSATLILYLWRLDISIKENIMNIKASVVLNIESIKNNFKKYELSR